VSFSLRKYDAVVIGSGPNGLAAAITLARDGRSVLVVEGRDTIGGGTRSAELTLPGFLHDVCSAVLPMGIGSPFFRGLPLADHGLRWIQPSAPLAHPLDDCSAVIVERSVEQTAANLGGDGERYLGLMRRLAGSWEALESLLLGLMQASKHPLRAARFGVLSMQSASRLARSLFREQRGRALFAGMAAHSVLPLEWLPSGALGLLMATSAHAVGWPIAEGGSQSLAKALASYFQGLGGEIVTGMFIESLEQLPQARALLFDVTPRQLLRIAGEKFPASFRRKLENYRYGPGVCKLDWALDGPVPWAAKECMRAATVHVGGSLEEIEASERACWKGQHIEKPFVIFAQPTLFDSTRAPAGKQIAWAYCHTPNGSSVDMSERIENQIERFAPGFRKRILRRNVMVASSLAQHNPNLVGGDLGGGAATLGQFFLRPTWRLYRTPAKNIFLCSSSTPPGAGVHGLCGYRAARAALRARF
jgi:phytoene dehydrogenase-like protein